MRWPKSAPAAPRAAATRTRLVFAWRPTRVRAYLVWLEFYEIYEVFSRVHDGHWAEVNRNVINP